MDVISGLAGILLSLVFSYVPGARDWFGKLDGIHKRLVMLGILAAAALLLAGLACWEGATIGHGDAVPLRGCNQEGLTILIRTFLTAVVVNQAAYAISPKAKPEPVVETVYEDVDSK